MKKAKYYFLPANKEAKPYEYPVIGFDTETDKKGNMIIACTYGERYKAIHHKNYKKGISYNDKYETKIVNEENVFYNEADLQDYLNKLYFTTNKKHPSAIICGFNLNYDANYIFEIIDKPLIANGDFIGGKLSNGIKLYDLTKHVDGSLEKWIETLKMNDVGIYKTKWYNDMPMSKLVYHCQNDAKATWYLGKFIQNFYINTFNVKMNYTIGSAALKIFRKCFFHDKWMRYYDDFNIFERKSFRGGRTETFKKGVFNLTTHDINSMYLSIMFDELIPNPNSAKWGKIEEFNEIRNRYDYIIHCDLFVPKQHIAPLPYYDEKMKKMLFPCGYLTGCWCKPELEYAIKNCGVKILKIHEYTYYTESKPYFHNFASYVWKQRKIFKDVGNDGMSLMVKKIGNSGYGKFGESDEQSGVFELKDYDFDLHLGDEVLHFKKGNKEYVKTYGESFDSWHTFPVIVSFITSYARRKILKRLKENEDVVVYCDTDSIKLPDGIPFVNGNGLGEWKNEGTEKTEIKRPKFYIKYDKDGVLDMEHSKIGGVPKRAKFLGINDNGQYGFQFEKPIRIGESIRKFNKHHIMTWNKWNTMTKWISPKDNKRMWKDNESEPIFIEKE